MQEASKHFSDKDNDNKYDEERLRDQIGLFDELSEQVEDQVKISLPGEVGEIASAVKKDVLKRLEEIKKKTELERNRDRNEPVSTTNILNGNYKELLGKLEIIYNEVNGEKYAFWLAYLPESAADSPPSAKSAIDVLEMISDAHARTSKMQRLRYNLWALEIIYVAADSPGWHEELGVIDVLYLDQSVHSLYTMTHDERLGKENNIENRITAIQILLSMEKIPLEAF
ncbi:MAG: hypothetical protein GXY44_13865 [Phycisphaerales bacterium]|nr:hypothetical protein [Phycisphaerales bacterium]